MTVETGSKGQKLGLRVGEWVEVKSTEGCRISHSRMEQTGIERERCFCNTCLSVSFPTGNNKGNHIGGSMPPPEI